MCPAVCLHHKHVTRVLASAGGGGGGVVQVTVPGSCVVVSVWGGDYTDEVVEVASSQLVTEVPLERFPNLHCAALG